MIEVELILHTYFKYKHKINVFTISIEYIILTLLYLNELHISIIFSREHFVLVFKSKNIYIFKHRILFITFQYKKYTMYYIYFIISVIYQNFFCYFTNLLQ